MSSFVRKLYVVDAIGNSFFKNFLTFQFGKIDEKCGNVWKFVFISCLKSIVIIVEIWKIYWILLSAIIKDLDVIF